MNVEFELETEEFRAWTEAAIENLHDEQAELFLEAMAMELISRLIKKTPVDTGRARGGWSSYALAKGLPVPIGPDLEEWARGLTESSFRERFGGAKSFIVISNAVPYIVVLEFGHSSQAPAGMLRITFRELMAGSMSPEMSERLHAMVQQANRTARVRAQRRRGRRRLPG